MRTRATLLAAVIAGLLTGCGGGGGSSTPAVSTTPTPSPTPTPAPTPAPSYADASSVMPTSSYSDANNTQFFNDLNAARLATGAGAVTQNTTMDKGAANHTNYFVVNDLLVNSNYITTHSWHDEASTYTGFTGVDPSARQRYVGYTGGVGEIMSAALADVTGDGCFKNLVDSTVYHRAIALGTSQEVGISYQLDSHGNSVCVMDLGTPSTSLGQLPANPVAYPYNNQVGIRPHFVPATETPNPAPDITDAGTPIMVSLLSKSAGTALNASDIVIKTFSITPQGSAAPVAARVLAVTGVTSTGPTISANDALSLGGSGVIFLLPTAPLAANTTYSVSFSGTVKGAPIAMHWSFTTGTMN